MTNQYRGAIDMGGVYSLWFVTIGGVGLFVVTRPACNKAFGDFGAHIPFQAIINMIYTQR